MPKRSYIITWDSAKKMFDLEMREDDVSLGGASISCLSGELDGLSWDEEWLKGEKNVTKK